MAKGQSRCDTAIAEYRREKKILHGVSKNTAFITVIELLIEIRDALRKEKR